MNQMTATIYVPAKAASDVTVNGKALSEADHVTVLKMDKGKAVLNGWTKRIQSHFELKNKQMNMRRKLVK